jgi:hypothetical protein
MGHKGWKKRGGESIHIACIQCLRIFSPVPLENFICFEMVSEFLSVFHVVTLRFLNSGTSFNALTN